MKTCGSLTLGLLIIAVVAALVWIGGGPTGQDIKNAGPLASMLCLVGPMIAAMGAGLWGFAKNEPKATGGRGGGCVAAVGVGVTALIVGGILLLCAKWTGG